MLEDVPLEILQQIISHLPTASSVVNLLLTSRKLNSRISADNYEILRTWIRSRFPTIEIPPLWRESAAILTARSRAWERRAFVARECTPPWGKFSNGWLTYGAPMQNFGYVPVIDSYETWPGSSWKDRKEVLAWGAAGRLNLRITERGEMKWTSLKVVDDHLSQNDILDVKLLRPEQNSDQQGETILIRRANNVLAKVTSTPEQNVFHQISTFETDSAYLDCMDISNSQNPILAVCNTKSIRLYSAKSEEERIKPTEVLELSQNFGYRQRKRCSKYLTEQRLAVSIQFIEGRTRSPINIYDLTPSGLVGSSLTPIHALDSNGSSPLGRHCANTIATLDNTSSLSGRAGDVFLSGWTDGIIKLYDLRTPLLPRMEYLDSVDDGQILSLLPIGHERFLAGSHHNACLKTFDMRMPGAIAYSYTQASLKFFSKPPYQHSSSDVPDPAYASPASQAPSRRDINIFLALNVHHARRLWQPLPRRQDSRLPRYRGSIYSLSSPSSSSPTVYCGIENYVIQLDFASTDDARTQNLGVTAPALNLPTTADKANEILNLSCYERPRPGHESTDPILLRKQVDWTDRRRPRSVWPADSNSREGIAEEGWDERWRLAVYDRNSRSGSGWRHPPPT